MDISHDIDLSYVAKRHLIDRRTKVEIAEELGVSRFKIARLIDEAYATGVVKVSVTSPAGLDFELSTRLKDQFNLRHAAVVEVVTRDEEETRRALAPVGASLLAELVQEDDTIGVSTGRSVQQLGKHLPRLPYADVVQLTGVADPNIRAGMEIVSLIARASGGRSHFLYSPLTVSDASTAAAIRRQPAMRRTLEKIDQLKVALVTIGSWDPVRSQLFENMADIALRDRLLAGGVRGEICATLTSDDGRISDDLADVAISATTAQLAKARDVMAVAGGGGKTSAIRGVLNSRLVSVLVTDSLTARDLLS